MIIEKICEQPFESSNCSSQNRMKFRYAQRKVEQLFRRSFVNIIDISKMINNSGIENSWTIRSSFVSFENLLFSPLFVKICRNSLSLLLHSTVARFLLFGHIIVLLLLQISLFHFIWFRTSFFHCSELICPFIINLFSVDQLVIN